MNTITTLKYMVRILFLTLLIIPLVVFAEPPPPEEEEFEETTTFEERRDNAPPIIPATRDRNFRSRSKFRRTRTRRRRIESRYRDDRKKRYFIEDPGRIDAGTFHVAFVAGGNFYIEPKFDSNNAPLGEYFKDFGFQAGVYFDYDYDDIRLGLRGFVGYKRVLSSTNVFDFEGMVRYLFTLSEKTKFGLGVGFSAGIWFREITDTSLDEEVIFLPAFLIEAGFDFNPFVTDFKFLINRIGEDSTILGFELVFGVRL